MAMFTEGILIVNTTFVTENLWRMAIAEFGDISRDLYRGKTGQEEMMAINEVGGLTGGDRPREHCIVKRKKESKIKK